MHINIKSQQNRIYPEKDLQLLQHLRWSFYNNSLHLQAVNYCYREPHLRCYGGRGSASDNVFINDVK